MRYKTSKRQREYAKRWYWANRERAQAAQKQWRRAQGVQARKPPMTEQEKRVLVCRDCGKPTKWRRLCGACQHERYPTMQYGSVRRWRRKHLAKVRVIKVKRGCEKCGMRTKDSKKLDFHHRDPKTKLFKLGQAGRYSWMKVQAEIAKCDVLCKQCHKKQH